MTKTQFKQMIKSLSTVRIFLKDEVAASSKTGKILGDAMALIQSSIDERKFEPKKSGDVTLRSKGIASVLPTADITSLKQGESK